MQERKQILRPLLLELERPSVSSQDFVEGAAGAAEVRDSGERCSVRVVVVSLGYGIRLVKT
jgi:hypothetical protein